MLSTSGNWISSSTYKSGYRFTPCVDGKSSRRSKGVMDEPRWAATSTFFSSLSTPGVAGTLENTSGHGKQMTRRMAVSLSKQRLAAELAANNGPLAGVHHPVGVLHQERRSKRGTVSSNRFGTFFVQIVWINLL